jgi:spermidine synthase
LTLTALVLMVASGFAGLGYQIVWTQQFSLFLGHESAAVLAIVSALFGGLAAGSFALSGLIQKSTNPARWYAACEFVIGFWCVALSYLLAPVSNIVMSVVGPQPSASWQWFVSFASTFLLLLPATVAMGATLPAMERLLSAIQKSFHQKYLIGALYAANTLGATLGVLAAAFWLIPMFGLTATAFVCAGLNLLCAIVAMNMSSAAVALESKATAESSQTFRLPFTLAMTGLLGIGYEVLIVRVISQVTENTVFTFAILLAVYLIGTALGAAAYQRNYTISTVPNQVDLDTLKDRLFAFQILTCLSGMLSLWASPVVLAWTKQQLGSGVAGALSAEAFVAIMAFGPATFVMGLLFSHLCTRATQQELSFGRALGINTLGAAIAPPLFGVFLVPLLGAKVALLIIATSYLALSGKAVLGKARTVFCVASIVAIAMVAPPMIFIDYPEGGRVVNHAEGVLATVSVVQDAAGIKSLRINNRQQEGSSNTLATDSRLALLPLLLHAAPKQVLFLGLGTGVTASSAAQDPSIQVEAAELLPEVIAASNYFRLPTSPAQKTNLTFIATDARRYVRASSKLYDIVISDNFHPARSGTGALYSVEHFRAIQQRLATGGLFCQWLPLHQLDLKTVQSIVQSFLAVYPQGAALLATNSLETPVLGLIAFQQGKGPPPSVQMIKQRLVSNTLSQPLADFGFKDEFSIAGAFVGGASALKRFAGHAPLNTDDHPIVNYIAPSITYAAVSSPADRLAAFLKEMRPHRDELSFQADPEWSQRLLAYWSARDQFIDLGRQTRLSNNPQAMLNQVREPLLAILRSSPDFTPAYDPLIKMALALAPTEPSAAIELLNTLRQIQPLRPEAGEQLIKLQ